MEKIKVNLPPFLLGFCALTFQILLMREFTVQFYGNEITYGLLLGAWLLWGGFGSIIGSRIRFTPARFRRLYPLVYLLFALCLGVLRLMRYALQTLPGQPAGTLQIFLAALFFSFFIGAPLGVLFVFNVHSANGQLAKVYLMESLGSAAAGLCLNFILLPLFSNWQIASILGAGLVLASFLAAPLNVRGTLVLSLLVAGGLWLSDIPSQKAFWAPFSLIKSEDTIYGTLHVVQTGSQLSLYSNGVRMFSTPDPASAEEFVHFVLLNKPDAAGVLLIGSGSGEEIGQILRYPHTSVDCVELNPAIYTLTAGFLPKQTSSVFKNPRVKIFHEDGIKFIKQATRSYDVIFLNLPDPSSALLNRFFTQEFFMSARNRLTPGGILSFRVSSAENYISSELQNYLSSLYHTLKTVFPDVEIYPGLSNVFLASSNLPPLDAEVLSKRLQELGLDTPYVNPELLHSRLFPLRVDALKKALVSGKNQINSDLAPISYFFNSILWSKQFKSFEAPFFSALAPRAKFWLLNLPLIVSALIFCILGLIKRHRSVFYLTPLIIMGLSSLLVEVVVIFRFQSVFGLLYQKVSLLFASFMLGLAAGVLKGRRPDARYSRLAAIQLSLILLILFSLWFIPRQTPQIMYFAFLFVLGFLNGHLFVVSNTLYLKKHRNYGLGYGLDLLGSFAGASVASALLIPLLGFPLLLKYILFFNALCLLFIGWGFIKKVS